MLTTIPIAASCLTETWLMSVPGGSAIVLGKPDDPDCWPGTRDLTTTISPAICPSGYSSACDITDASRRDESETIWACCPTGFHCDDGTWSCLAEPTNTYTVTYLDFQGKTTTSLTTWDGGVNAHSVRIALHSSDLLNPVSSTIFSSDSNIPAQTSTSLPTPTSIITPSSAAEGLPAGAWVGIGIAIAAGAFGLIASIAWLIRRKRRKSNQQLSSQQPQDVTQLPQQSNPNYTREALTAVHPVEMGGASGAHELETKSPNASLAHRGPIT
ncbi:hypothetical protein F4678DRAFT_410359 [Xylaria arbuscula]|nr:hypothetical protein F4678DRAFT_410359 [Xylaria arbuscula]